jgi:hypothetical protein
MQKALLVGALMLAAGAAAALPAANTTVLGVGTGALTPDIITKVLGYTPESATITTFGLDGLTKREVSWDELKVALASTSFGAQTDGPVPTNRCGTAALGVYCGPDTGKGTLGASGFCDNSSGWIGYSGYAPGSAITELTNPKPTNIVTCGGFFGKTFDWDAVELSPIPVLDGVSIDGCFATTWTIHSNGYCPNPFSGPADTYLWHWRAGGTGVMANLGFGTNGFDYFLGNGAANSYDLPAGVMGP